MRSDPWWHGREPTRMKFLDNGTVIINPTSAEVCLSALLLSETHH